jgi:hypothetical protein
LFINNSLLLGQPFFVVGTESSDVWGKELLWSNNNIVISGVDCCFGNYMARMWATVGAESSKSGQFWWSKGAQRLPSKDPVSK